ncbi:hypothetical protein KP509_24G013800 [Ceratopteris richardii]|uniref:CG-1 domain-containing protein n=3 Tax=Ceratopteris richardii TaxID=49495 RepID=A0A8T2RV18_CERRI|nr:hypothetical protein KP509_24G013800 [Ceratopteris richardii]
MDHRRYGGLPGQPETALCQILKDAQHRWLRPTEVCEILQNYQKFKLTPHPPNKPESGALFLFDRKALRYFRRDGHNWRKKKDRKTVREAHERLKAGSVEVLHCYYAHGEDNENFQRRSYWMLDANEHIVLVHYREVKEGSKSGFHSPNSYSIDGGSSFGNPHRVAGTSPQTSPLVSPRSSTPSTTDWNGGPACSPERDEPESSEDTDGYRLREGEAAQNAIYMRSSLAERATSVVNHGHQSSYNYTPINKDGAHHGEGALQTSYEAPPGGYDLYEYGEALKQVKGWGSKGTSEFSTIRLESGPEQYKDERILVEIDGLTWQSNLAGYLHAASVPEDLDRGDILGSAQVSSVNNINASPLNAVFPHLDGFDNPLLNGSHGDDAYSHYITAKEHGLDAWKNANRFDASATGADVNISPLSHLYSSFVRDSQADICRNPEDARATKAGNFERWMAQGIDSNGMISPDSEWANVFAEEIPILPQQMHMDIQAILSTPQEICFSITDFSPNCITSDSNTKVLVCGKFRDTVKYPAEFNWCCMFGDAEVPAEILEPGCLRCIAPARPPGKVPFFVTRGDRIACSEIKEFEYHVGIRPSFEALETAPFSKRDMLFQIRLAKMLGNISVPSGNSFVNPFKEDMVLELRSLRLFGEWEAMEEQLTEAGLKTSLKGQFIEKLLKEKLQIWLLQKVIEGGKGPAVWDDNGLGVLHIGAALGYTWIIAPLLAAGLNINFRDSRGWTALHWAAHCGREAMVTVLMARGASAGAKTDPTTGFPSGQTPADLASAEGYKGIAGYLAESSLTSHLSSLNLKSSSSEALPILSDGIQFQSKDNISQPSVGPSEEQLPLTLAAVRNAAQAVARIQSEFRVESFRRKQESYQHEEDEFGISNEEAQYIAAAQKPVRGQFIYGDELSHVNAAIRIQQNYRGWKGRRSFLVFRQNVVKIQAHFRGHQVRKQYRILWSVSIVKKLILWRRKGRGLRGLVPLPESSLEGNEEDDDFLRAGRKQIEIGLEKALARVQSMVRSPEAQEQYCRLLEGYQKLKADLEGDYDMPSILEDEGHIF